MYTQLVNDLWPRLQRFHNQATNESAPAADQSDMGQRLRQLSVVGQHNQLLRRIKDLDKHIKRFKSYITFQDDEISFDIPEKEPSMHVDDSATMKGDLEKVYEAAWQLCVELKELKKKLENVDFSQPPPRKPSVLSIDDLARGKGGGRSDAED